MENRIKDEMERFEGLIKFRNNDIESTMNELKELIDDDAMIEKYGYKISTTYRIEKIYNLAKELYNYGQDLRNATTNRDMCKYFLGL